MKSKFPTGIGNLINKLKNEGELDNNRVAEIVKNSRIPEKELLPFTSYDHCPSKSYGRTLIFSNENFKVLLMSWKSGDFTAIHNHGYTKWGCVYFFGDTEHRLYQVETNKLSLVHKSKFLKGDMVSVSGELTHLMGNSGAQNFTTLHIYGNNSGESNALVNAKVYIPEHQKIATTLGSAYLNMKRELVVKEEPLFCKNHQVLYDYYSLVKPFYERNNLNGVLVEMENSLKLSEK